MSNTQNITCCCHFGIESFTILWRGEPVTQEALQVAQQHC